MAAEENVRHEQFQLHLSFDPPQSERVSASVPMRPRQTERISQAESAKMRSVYFGRQQQS